MSIKLQVLAVFAMLLLACFLTAEPARAQYVCPTGPGPGERQVGSTPASNGMGSMPLCVSDGTMTNNGGGGASKPNRNYWGAAVQGADGKIQVAYQQPSKQFAESAAMTACVAKNAGKCTVIGIGAALSFGVARGSNNVDYFASKATNGTAAEAALKLCRKANPNCQLIAVIDTVLGPQDPAGVLLPLP